MKDGRPTPVPGLLLESEKEILENENRLQKTGTAQAQTRGKLLIFSRESRKNIITALHKRRT